MCLVIPGKVIDELDIHKNQPANKRIKKRARMALSKIESYNKANADSPVREGTYLLRDVTCPGM